MPPRIIEAIRPQNLKGRKCYLCEKVIGLFTKAVSRKMSKHNTAIYHFDCAKEIGLVE